jgi:hypothetical protein
MRLAFLAVVVAVVAAVGVALGVSSLRASSHQPSIQIECRFFHRPEVTKDVRRGPVVALSSRRRDASGRAGPFGFRITTGVGPRQGEPDDLSVRVWSRRSGRPVTSAIYQFGGRQPANQFGGGHGFTGLVYAYLATGAELQYFCRAL